MDGADAVFHYIEALNVSEDAIALYAGLVHDALEGRARLKQA